MRKMLATSFGEWGAIEDIHIVPSKCISFVRYKFRASAEFAKEAMMGQKLEDSIEDSLVVRWANDDPNARAIERVKREREYDVLDAMHVKQVFDGSLLVPADAKALPGTVFTQTVLENVHEMTPGADVFGDGHFTNRVVFAVP